MTRETLTATWVVTDNTAVLVQLETGKLLAAIVKRVDGLHFVSIFNLSLLGRWRMWTNHPHDGDMRVLWTGTGEFSKRYKSMNRAIKDVTEWLRFLDIEWR